MQHSLEDILKDIYALDPSLQKDDTTVRALVSELTAAKPAISVDGVFVRTLREQLITKPISPAKPVLSPWFMYVTPVAAMAVLLLMLIPNQPTSYGPTEAPVIQSDMYLEVDNVGATKRTAPALEEASMMMAPADMAEDTMMSGDSVVVLSQLPGTTVAVEYLMLSNPGFVVVESAGPQRRIIGMSGLLSPGEYRQFSVPLMVPMMQNSPYMVTLYQDDGDGSFSPTLDTVVYDGFGTAVQQLFEATYPVVR